MAHDDPDQPPTAEADDPGAVDVGADQGVDAVAVVVVAHGSRAEGANRAHEALVAALTGRLGRPAVPAFLELGEPTVPATIDRVVAEGARTVLVLPYFLHPGRHHARDLPALVHEAGGRHPGVTVRLLDLFGADPALVDLLGAQVTAALAHPPAG